MNDLDEAETLMQFEGLVISTVRFWRHLIPDHVSTEDAQQELRIKALKAIRAFDPSRGYPLERHVFGAVRNRIKDMIAMKHRKETYVEGWAWNFGDGEEEGWDVAAKVTPHMAAQMTHSPPDLEPLLDGLTREQKEICLLLMQGFKNTEVMKRLGLSMTDFRREITVVKEHLGAQLVERGRLPASAVASR